MDKIRNLLMELKNDSIDIVLIDDNLEVSYDTEDLDLISYNKIKENKDELIQFLKKHNNATATYLPIPVTTSQANYPVTPSQNSFWMMSQLEGGSLAYNMPGVVKLKGNIAVDKFEESFRRLIHRHEILRTYFKINDEGIIRQYIVPAEAIDFAITLEDYCLVENQENAIANYLQEKNSEPFDLEKVPLIRASLIKLKSDEYVFFLSMHHIIGDGWSMEILISEVVKTYNALVQDKEITFPELKIQYKDYATWLNDELQLEKHELAEQYWLKQFSGELPILDLPAFKPRPLIQTYNGNKMNHHFSKNFLEDLKEFSNKNGATLFMTLMAGINVLLHKYTDQDDVIVGTPTAGREHPDLVNQIGLYLNTLAIRTQINRESSFLDVVIGQKETLLAAYEHQIYPFDALVGKLNLNRDTSRSPLFDVLVVLQNQKQANNTSKDSLQDLNVESYGFNTLTAKFDFEFVFVETEDGLSLNIAYNTDVYETFQISKIGSHLENLLTQVLYQPQVLIQNIDLLDFSEKKEVLEDFNDTKVNYPANKTIIDLFEEQAEKTPNNIALVFENNVFTYKELNEQANQFGAYLRNKYNILPDDLIGIKLDRSDRLILTILGILKSGGAYVPIDTNYPQERIEYVQKDCQSKVIIDEQELELFYKVQEQNAKVNLEKINQPSDLAYVIYTSGTTGHPKGVMVSHRNVVRLIKPCSYFPLNEENILLSTGSVSFDATIVEFFGTLLNGSQLILTNQNNLLDVDQLESLLKFYNVDSLWMTSSWFNNVVESNINFFECLNKLVIGGDVISTTHVLKVFDNHPNINIISAYGPTENTAFSTTYPIKRQKYNSIPIGKAIPNSQVYILDQNLQPVSIGIKGRLYVAGAGVARGYLNKPELTQEKFVPNPFSKGEFMYDSGDLACWLPDGNIEFLGRKDQQVKIRGFRIELPEIENAIAKYSKDVAQVVVETREINNEKTLVAYLVSNNSIDKTELRNYLLKCLPEYMVPAFYIELKSIPLNGNGKIDRKSLPGISGEDLIKQDYVAPRNEVETKLAVIWQDVLKVEQIGVTDNFFDLGGHSLIIIQVINKINKELGRDISYKNFFLNPTIEKLSEVLKENKFSVIPKAPVLESYPLTLAQTQYWLMNQTGEISKAYEIRSIFKIKGNLDIEIFEKAFHLLINRHEILRSYFKITELGDVNQYVLDQDKVSFKINKFEILNANYDQILSLINEKSNDQFDLEKAPLIKNCLIKTNQNEYVFFVSLYHIIADGRSLEIMVKEVLNLYKHLINKAEITLPELRIQYKDYVLWLKNNEEGKRFEIAENYWINQFKGEIPVLKIPTLKNRPLLKTFNGKSGSYQFSNEFYTAFKLFNTENNLTSFMTLTSALNLLLHTKSDQNDIIIGTPVSARNHSELEGLVGVFTNVLALRTKINTEERLIDFFEFQKHQILESFDNQIYPFYRLSEKLSLERDLSRSGLFDVMISLNTSNSNSKVDDFHEFIIEPFDLKGEISQFDLNFVFTEFETLNLNIQFNTDVFEDLEIEVMMRDLDLLMTKIFEDKNSIIKDLKENKEKISKRNENKLTKFLKK